jgi:hypothetical protein
MNDNKTGACLITMTALAGVEETIFVINVGVRVGKYLLSIHDANKQLHNEAKRNNIKDNDIKVRHEMRTQGMNLIEPEKSLHEARNDALICTTLFIEAAEIYLNEDTSNKLTNFIKGPIFDDYRSAHDQSLSGGLGVFDQLKKNFESIVITFLTSLYVSIGISFYWLR